MSPRKKFLWDRQKFETMFSIGITNSTFSAKLAHPLHRIVLEMCLLCSNQERGAKATVDFFFVNIFSEIRVPNVSEKFLKVWFALGTEEKNSRSFGPPISQKIWKKKRSFRIRQFNSPNRCFWVMPREISARSETPVAEMPKMSQKIHHLAFRFPVRFSKFLSSEALIELTLSKSWFSLKIEFHRVLERPDVVKFVINRCGHQQRVNAFLKSL